MGFGLKWFDEFCKDCPDRKVCCHNTEICSKWVEHEKKKEEAYNERQKAHELSQIEVTHWKHRIHKYEHDHRR